MHVKTTIVLLIGVVLLAGIIRFFETDDKQLGEVNAVEKAIIRIEPEKIDYLALQRDESFIECKKNQSEWTIQTPIKTRADTSRINWILGVLEMLTKGEIISSSERNARELTLDHYGLARPRGRIVVGAGDKRCVVQVGNESPLRDTRYVRVDEGGDVIVTSTNVWDVIPRDVSDVRDLRILQGDPSLVRRLEIKHSQGPLIQLIRERTEWLFRKPVQARADCNKVTILVERLLGLQIQKFISETMADPVAYGLSDDEAVVQIGVWQSDENGDRLWFGKPVNENTNLVYVRCKGSSSIVAVKKEIVDLLKVKPRELWDPTLFLMDTERIRYLRIEDGEKALCIQKFSPDQWQIVEPEQWKADSRVVRDFIEQFNTLPVEATIDEAAADPAEFGLDKPTHIFRVSNVIPSSGVETQQLGRVESGPGSETRSLLLGRVLPGKSSVFARFDDEPQIYQLAASVIADMTVDPAHYRDRTVLQIAPSTVRRLILKQQDNEQTVERRQGDTWVTAPPDTGSINPAAIRNVLAIVSDLKALRFERSDPEALSRLGLKDGSVSITIGLTGEEGIQKTLVIGAPSEDLGVYAMVRGQDVLFVLEKSVVQSLTRDLIQP